MFFIIYSPFAIIENVLSILGIQTKVPSFGVGTLDSLVASTPIRGPEFRPSKRRRIDLEDSVECDTSNDYQEPLDITYTPGESVLTEESDTS